MTRVAAVIPNYNGRDHLPNLLADLNAQTRRPDSIVVVDDASTDDSPVIAESQGCTVLCQPTNVGFARAVNAGVRAAESATYAAILNTDVRLDPRWLEQLVSALENQGASYATGKILSAGDPRLIDGTWDLLSRGATALRTGSAREDSDFWSRPRTITFAPFTAILVHRDTFLGLGGLDEALEMYLEDVEFGLRSGSEGHTGLYVPAAVARHIGSASRGHWNARTVRQIARNQLLIVARHYPTGLLREFGWPIAVAQLLWGVVALRHGRPLAWLLGKWDGVRAFRRYRRKGSPHVRIILTESEKEIRAVQSATGFDWYWKLYFALTRR